MLKFEHNDILLEELHSLARKEKIMAAALIFIGALKRGDLVTGPKKPVIPPQPNKIRFRNGWEAMGMGTIFTGKSGPQIHIHGSMGKKNKVLTGCVRGRSQVFLVMEAVIFELKNVKASKSIDPRTGLNLLNLATQ